VVNKSPASVLTNQFALRLYCVFSTGTCTYSLRAPHATTGSISHNTALNSHQILCKPLPLFPRPNIGFGVEVRTSRGLGTRATGRRATHCSEEHDVDQGGVGGQHGGWCATY
jgi:hypothetical protein